MRNEVILVDFNDEPMGTAEKMEAHERGLLHRAFSVFLFCEGRLLLQKRALSKYHCPGLWTNSCCSHPRPGESTADAAVRRLSEELGIDKVELREIGSFFYRQKFDNGLTEFECDHVFVGSFSPDTEFVSDPEEVEETAWWDFDELLEKLRTDPEAFTPWFLICAPEAIKAIKEEKYI